MLSSQQKEEIARNRHIVKEIIDVLILFGCQNIAIRRGYTVDKGNSMAVLRHVSKHDEILQYQLDNPEPNSRIKYTRLQIYKTR